MILSIVLRTLNADYKPPLRTTLSESCVPSLAKEIEENLVKSLQSAEFMSIATDGWSTPSAESVIAVTAHFIDQELSLNSVTLGIESLSDLTAKGHAAKINEVLRKYSNQNAKIVALVSDTTAVMPATARVSFDQISST